MTELEKVREQNRRLRAALLLFTNTIPAVILKRPPHAWWSMHLSICIRDVRFAVRAAEEDPA